MAEWVWASDDFAALWYSDGIDRFPRPLHYQSRFHYVEDYESHRAHVLAALDQDESELIRLALHTLTFGQLRIEIRGGSTATNPGTMREYRIVGAQNGQHGVVLAQAIVNGVDGPIHGRLFPSEHLPKRLAERVPRCTPGRQVPISVDVLDVESGAAHQSYARRSPREEYEALTRRPIDGSGQARLLVGHILDRPEPWYTTQWVDLSDDGRYLQRRTRDRITVRPAVADDLSVGFAGWIERAQRRLREEEPAVW
ncbi:ESX secretion-associated protein EspG [Nocardia sp. NPDC058666]|uniref:ESX secretion-associated protein EspG n=1 Tax=Nocardia sp. NPDC058666 TaxID=3346587 RepID=UPI003656202D